MGSQGVRDIGKGKPRKRNRQRGSSPNAKKLLTQNKNNNPSAQYRN